MGASINMKPENKNSDEASGFEVEKETQSIESSKPPRLPISVGGRDALMKAITNNVKLIEQIGESPFLTARQVLDVLKSQKLLSPMATAKIKSANGVGDALGRKHLDLPFIIEGGKRAYLIQAAAWTVEEKEEFDDKTPDEKLAFMESLFTEAVALIQAARAVEDEFEETLAFDEGLSTEAVA